MRSRASLASRWPRPSRSWSGLAKQPDKIAVALRTSQVTFRNLGAPHPDKKAIQAGVAFELEDEMPFSVDDAQFDYSTLAQTKQGTTVHVAATLKKHLAGFLASGAPPASIRT